MSGSHCPDATSRHRLSTPSTLRAADAEPAASTSANLVWSPPTTASVASVPRPKAWASSRMLSSISATVLGLSVSARSLPRPASTSALWTVPSAASHAGHVSCVSTSAGRTDASHSTSS
eukprot:985054-Rhodomonas_salina.2